MEVQNNIRLDLVYDLKSKTHKQTLFVTITLWLLFMVSSGSAVCS